MVDIVVLPHFFGLKDAQDKLFVPMMLGATRLSCSFDTITFLNPNSFLLNIPSIDEWLVQIDSVSGVADFRSSYVHLSTNKDSFERFCIERFFVLREFFRSRDLDGCLCIETDVVPFDDFGAHVSSSFDMSINWLSGKTCISTAWITRSFVELFCDGVLRFYSSERVHHWRIWFDKYVSEGKKGGLCDMTFCRAIAEGTHGFEQLPVQDISTPVGEGDTFYAIDNFIGRDQLAEFDAVFPMEKSMFGSKVIREIRFDSMGPYCRADDGRIVRLLTVHCQGEAKSLIGIYISRWMLRSKF